MDSRASGVAAPSAFAPELEHAPHPGARPAPCAIGRGGSHHRHAGRLDTARWRPSTDVIATLEHPPSTHARQTTPETTLGVLDDIENAQGGCRCAVRDLNPEPAD